MCLLVAKPALDAKHRILTYRFSVLQNICANQDDRSWVGSRLENYGGARERRARCHS